MVKKGKAFLGVSVVLVVGITVGSLVSCSTTVTREQEFTPGGQIAYERQQENQQVIYELRRVFAETSIEGIGIFENANEGLARRSAINLAINDLASQVQAITRSESAIYNNMDVRDVVETRVKAVVEGYKIESEGYDPNTIKYRVRIRIDGEQLVRQIERMIVR